MDSRLTETLTETLTVVTALGCGLVAGVFFAFSGFVLAGLDRLPGEQAGAAMQQINVTAVRAPLMVALFGTALGAVLVAALAVHRWTPTASPWLLAGALLYLIGAVGVTIAGNVPLNDALAAGTRTWEQYRGPWTLANQVRTLTSLAAAGCLTVALRAG
ncbi:anthrone oxygenase family protein [Kineosporia succinea]|uniref:Membrane protein n=1 Tax=Kineosporia succinea TaxID=84632 RepID=A0ABT9P629_9ACTN|nr:anthrone oxygenase family protein [Kineosporia succinea]MDP9828128.1 putative membrane protein [Kineosporia succinea]